MGNILSIHERIASLYKEGKDLREIAVQLGGEPVETQFFPGIRIENTTYHV